MNLEESIRSEKTYVPNIASQKGNTTWINTALVVTDYIKSSIEIIKANKIITINRDIIFVKNTPLFVNIIRKLKFTTIKCITNRTPTHIAY